MTYTAIYRTNTTYEEPVRLLATESVAATIMPGPLEYCRAVPIQHHLPGAVTMTVGLERHRTSEGQFLVLSYLRAANAGSSPNAVPLVYPRRADAALAVTQVVALIALAHPGLLAEKVFEGAVSDQQNVTFQPEGPVTFSTPHLLEPLALSTSLQESFSALQVFDEPHQSRFRLASRWFLRGHEAQNPVDRFLYWFISLEVYPSEGKMKVVSAVKKLLASKVYPDMNPSVISERIGIGRIHGIRSQIVHEGLSYVDLPLDHEFDTALKRLGAITSVCLRLLAGFPPGDDLDPLVRI